MNVYLVRTIVEFPQFYDGGDPLMDISIKGIYTTKELAYKRFSEVVQDANLLSDEDGYYCDGHEILYVEMFEYKLNSKDEPKKVKEVVIGKEES